MFDNNSAVQTDTDKNSSLGNRPHNQIGISHINPNIGRLDILFGSN